MIRVLLVANDSLLADSIASILKAEIDLDVVRLTRRDLGKGERYSVVIIVDEEGSEANPIRFGDLFRDDVTLLVIMVSLTNRNIRVYESYQLNNPGMARVIDLVRNFGRSNLKKNFEAIFNGPAHGNDRHIVI
jgi:hypothetical protein